jgi:hypothetical protein
VNLKISVTSAVSLKTVSPTINYQDLSGSLKVTLITPASLSVLVSGPIDKLATIDGQVVINLPLSIYKSAGTYSVSITKEMLVLPADISLVSFLPSAIDVTLSNK